MVQGAQDIWLGPKSPSDIAQDSSPPQELEEAGKAGYFSRVVIMTFVVLQSEETLQSY